MRDACRPKEGHGTRLLSPNRKLHPKLGFTSYFAWTKYGTGFRRSPLFVLSFGPKVSFAVFFQPLQLELFHRWEKAFSPLRGSDHRVVGGAAAEAAARVPALGGDAGEAGRGSDGLVS